MLDNESHAGYDTVDALIGQRREFRDADLPSASNLLQKNVDLISVD